MQTTRTQVSPSSGVIRSRASPATSRKEALKNPAIRSYRRAPCNQVARKSFKELLTLGIREYRQIFFKPYRIIYRVMEKNVYVLLIVDGRRDMQSLLQRRLLDA